MEEIVSSVGRKIFILVTAMIVSAAALGFFSFGVARSAVGFFKALETEKFVSKLVSDVALFSPRVEEARALASHAANVKYGEPSTLREVLFKELGDMGLSVSEISLKEIPEKRFGSSVVVEMTVDGSIPAGSFPRFIALVSSRSKIWGVESMTMTPRRSPADMVSQFVGLHRRNDRRGLEEFVSQSGRLIEESGSVVFDVRMVAVVVSG